MTIQGHRRSAVGPRARPDPTGPARPGVTAHRTTRRHARRLTGPRTPVPLLAHPAADILARYRALARAGRQSLLVDERRNRTHAVRSWLGASVATLLLLAVFAAPISAAAGTSKLSNATVAPRSGTVATTIVVTVTYQNTKGSRAQTVTARIGGVDKTMTRVPGGDWGNGVVFRWSGTL